MIRRLALAAILAAAAAPAHGQQEADTSFHPRIESPAYPVGRGPVVAIHEGHANFHTANGRYRPFAEVLHRDGYVVRPSAGPIRGPALAGVRVLVVANALGEVREGEDTSASAFGPSEIERLRTWVEGGGSLLLIADHMPFPGAARRLAAALAHRRLRRPGLRRARRHPLLARRRHPRRPSDRRRPHARGAGGFGRVVHLAPPS
jgi:hypothetical protein